MPRTRRSPAQVAHSKNNLEKMNSSVRSQSPLDAESAAVEALEAEVTILTTSLEAANQSISKLQKRCEEYRIRKGYETRKLLRSRRAGNLLQNKLALTDSSMDNISGQLEITMEESSRLAQRNKFLELLTRSLMRERDNARRALHRSKVSVDRRIQQAKDISLQRQMKVKGGILSPEIREAIRELGSLGVPERKCNEVFNVAAKALGITLTDSFSHTSVQRIVREGGIASYIQIGHEMKAAKGDNLG
jgi:chromosome segregation ATPase